VSASATTLTDVDGLGALTAGKILAHVGDVDRSRSAAAFASYTGELIVESAYACFRKQGLQKVTIGDITKAAGVSRSTRRAPTSVVAICHLLGLHAAGGEAGRDVGNHLLSSRRCRWWLRARHRGGGVSHSAAGCGPE
jgi:hypothetical protein